MILPQNSIFYDLNAINKDNLYPMRGTANHIHAFQVPSEKYIDIKISQVTINSQDGILQGYFSDQPMGQRLFYGNTNVNPFVIKKNYSFNEINTGNHGSIFRIYSKDYIFDDKNIVYSKFENSTNSIVSEISSPDPNFQSYTPVKQIVDVATRLIVNPNQTYYVNLTNRQVKDITYKFLIDDETNPSVMDDTKCINNYQVSDESNLYPHFRYPSRNNVGGWS